MNVLKVLVNLAVTAVIWVLLLFAAATIGAGIGTLEFALWAVMGAVLLAVVAFKSQRRLMAERRLTPVDH